MKILFVTSTRIGDAVLSTSLLSYLIRKYPGASFTVACGPLPAPLFESAPGVERVIPINKKRFSVHWLSLWAGVVGTCWDLVIDLRASAFAWTVWASNRKVLRSREGKNAVHRVVELSTLLDLKTVVAPKLWLSERSIERAASIIPNGKTVIGLGVTANWLPKIWPAQNFISLAECLTSSDGLYPSAQIAVFGTEAERDLAKPVLEGVAKNQRIDLVGQNDLPTVAACLSSCTLFVGNDSGLMHMAAAVGTPTVGLFGPSPAARYGPWGEHCVAVESTTSYSELVGAADFDHRGSENLMGELSIEAVEQAVQDLWIQITGDPDG
ncbi:MAG: glycosyl transferase [Rhodospirillaceae bacterium]|nr:glycosyl transferase [Rhodospirillaceae bacterium]